MRELESCTRAARRRSSAGVTDGRKALGYDRRLKVEEHPGWLAAKRFV